MKYQLSLICFVQPEGTEDLNSSFCQNFKSQFLSVPLLIGQDDVFWSCVWFASKVCLDVGSFFCWWGFSTRIFGCFLCLFLKKPSLIT